MKRIAEKILVILLVLIINMNFIFPNFVYCSEIGETIADAESQEDVELYA